MRMGNVPMRMGIKSSFKIPQRTLVGQSGPPIRMEHLAMLSPGLLKMTLMVLIKSELMPTICLTATLLPRFSPMIFCWQAQARS